MIYGKFDEDFLALNGKVQIRDTLLVSSDGIKFSNDSEVIQAELVQYGIVSGGSVSFFGIIGEIKMLGKGVVLPDGLIPCDGRQVSRTEFSDLFTAIGVNYGDGDGSTTFNVPDFTKGIPVGE